MKNLNKSDWYQKLGEVRQMIERPHEDFEVTKKLAELWWTLAEMKLWQLPMIIWRTMLVEKAIHLHKSCCDLD